MPAAKKPADHLSKDAPFTFTAGGKSYTLPNAGEHAEQVPGGITMDAIAHPDDTMMQMRLGFAMLDAAKPTPKALEALRSLPTKAMLEVFGRWMGESSGSSD